MPLGDSTIVIVMFFVQGVCHGISPDLQTCHRFDVHQAKISACAVSEQPDGTVAVEHREFGGFKRDRRMLAAWARSFGPEVVVMESTGIYWKSPYAALERIGIHAWVVNARHVKTVPGRKTDVADAQWLATLARAGLLRASFIPPGIFATCV
jgi:transposase